MGKNMFPHLIPKANARRFNVRYLLPFYPPRQAIDTRVTLVNIERNREALATYEQKSEHMEKPQYRLDLEVTEGTPSQLRAFPGSSSSMRRS